MSTNVLQTKKILSVLLATLLPLLASAQTKVEIEGIWYNLDKSTKQAEVTSGNYESSLMNIPSTVVSEGINYEVTSIGVCAFTSCYSLTTISIPESVTDIGTQAFKNCHNLTTINILEGSRLTRIGGYAFGDCSSLTNINVPKGVTYIEDYAFYNCSSLTTINIPEGVVSIGSYAFSGCSALTTITISEGVTRIGKEAFYKCSNLTSINIPESITVIGDYAFYNCSNLAAVNIPQESQLTSIGWFAFYKCYKLTTINIPINVTRIGKGAFGYCYNLTIINIPESVTNIGGAAFQGCSSLTAVNIPEGLKLTSIEDNTFYGCNKLVTVNIPEGVTSIGNYAFQGCSTLTSINIPKEVTNIGGQAFLNCTELLDVYCYAEILPTVKSYAFDGTYPEKATLHVPTSAINSYKTTAPWNSFGNIVPIEEVEVRKCATPTISYADCKIIFACDTEEAIIKSNVAENIAGDYNDMEIAFISTYTITAYATKENYEDSDVATLTLCWIPCAEEHKSEEDGILAIPSKPVLISTRDGVLTLSGLAEDTTVTLYTTDGVMVAQQQSNAGEVKFTVDTNQVYIVHIGDKVVKIAM